jgi:hypothetical protein
VNVDAEYRQPFNVGVLYLNAGQIDVSEPRAAQIDVRECRLAEVDVIERRLRQETLSNSAPDMFCCLKLGAALILSPPCHAHSAMASPSQEG